MAVEIPNIACGGKDNYDTRMVRNRLKIINANCDSLENKTVLDVGCAYGGQTILIAQQSGMLYAIDFEEHKVEYFKKKLSETDISNISVDVGDAQALKFDDEFFDIVTAIEVLDHVESEEKVLNELNRVLKKDGTLVMVVPNKWWIFETHGANLPLLKWNRVPFFSWLPKKIHDRWAKARIYSKSNIRKLLINQGFKINSMTYLTAPMDEVKNPTIQKFLRSTIFRGTSTRHGILSTAIIVTASK